MRELLTTLFFLSTWFCMVGQIRVEGVLYSQEKSEKEPLPFANVLLKDHNDTAKIAFLTRSDLNGKYIFESLPEQNFQIEISCLGYKTHIEKIEITYPEVGNNLIFNFSLIPDPKQLDEVVVTAKSILRGLDKTTYMIKASDIKTSRFALDLLEIVPAISIDPVSQKLTSTKGSLKILINGISASEIDLKTIPPEKVQKIEHYDVPPARYLGYTTVINVVTKKLNNGFATGFTLQHAFTTGFFNDDIFLKYISGRHQFTADYTVNYRDYDNVNTETTYSYAIDNKNINRMESSKNPFGYTDHFINLKYNNQLKDNYVFQIKFSPNLNFRHSGNQSEISINEIEDSENFLYERRGFGFDNSNTFNPSLNLYYCKQMDRKQNFTFDIVGNFFKSEQNVYTQEVNVANSNIDLNDIMTLNIRKKSLIGELVFDKTMGLNKLSVGNKAETYFLSSSVKNSFNNKKYTSFYFSDYPYCDFTGMYGSFMYKFNLGLTYKRNSNFAVDYKSWIFNALCLIGYRINENNAVRIIYGQGSKEPDISEQSDNVVFVTDNILKKGNPYLKNLLSKEFVLKYSFNNRYFDIDVDGYYVFRTNNIAAYYVESDSYFLFTSINEKPSKAYGFNITGAIKPLGNDFVTIKFDGDYNKFYVDNDITGPYSYDYTPFGYSLQIKIGNKWMFSHRGKIVSYQTYGTYMKKDENNYNISLRYKNRSLSAFCSLLWMFEPSNYITKTIHESEVKYISNRKIFDNRNMITVGFSYTFNSGKKYEEENKLINNSDKDSGIFK